MVFWPLGLTQGKWNKIYFGALNLDVGDSLFSHQSTKNKFLA